MTIREITIIVVVSFAALASAAARKPAASRPTTAPHDRTFTLQTKSYSITITLGPDDGEVEDDRIVYHGVSRKTGKSITLKGKTLHTHDQDGTPVHFLGYEFKSGSLTYQILEQDHFRLVVFNGDDRVIVDEEAVDEGAHQAAGPTTHD